MKTFALLAVFCVACGGSSKSDGAAGDDLAQPDDLSSIDLATPPDMTFVCPDGGAMCNGTCYDTKSDIDHCGESCAICDAPNTTSQCSSSTCVVSACATDYMDCNHAYADGCESHLPTDPLHCGACDTPCALNQTCASSICGDVTLSFVEPPTAYTFPSSSRPAALVGGDFNGDGKNDMFIVTSNSVSSYVYLGDGMGGVTGGMPVTIAAGPFVSVYAGDFDHDDKLDVAALNGAGVTLLFGKGDGTFDAPTTYTTPDNDDGANALAIGDLNDDGYLDVVYADTVKDGLYVLINDKTGGFPTQTFVSTGVTGGQPQAIAMGELTGDHQVDLVIANYTAGSVSILQGAGSGAFTALTPLTTTSPETVTLGDLDDDGALDLLVTAGTLPHSVFMGTGVGTFGTPVTLLSETASKSAAIADLNGDGRLDLVIANPGDSDGMGHGAVSVFLGSGDHVAPLQYTSGPQGVFATGPYASAVALVDWNDDGRLDIATMTAVSADTVDVLINSTM